MANDFDQPPVYDDFIKQGTNKLSALWADFISTEYMNMIGYLTQNGMLMPQLTADQIDKIRSPQNGQLVYNTTTGTAQYFKAGTWTAF